MISSAPLMTIGEAARILDLSPDRLRQLERAGQIRAMRTSYGLRLYDPADVRALLIRRRERELLRRARHRQHAEARDAE